MERPGLILNILLQNDAFPETRKLNIFKEIMFRSSRPVVFLVKDVLKICSRFAGEQLCRRTSLDGYF